MNYKINYKEVKINIKNYKKNSKKMNLKCKI